MRVIRVAREYNCLIQISNFFVIRILDCEHADVFLYHITLVRRAVFMIKIYPNQYTIRRPIMLYICILYLEKDFEENC